MNLIQKTPYNVSDHKCVFIQLSIAHKLLVNVSLVTSFGSKTEPSSGHDTRTEKIESPHIIMMAISPLTLKYTWQMCLYMKHVKYLYI
jgi:hypothetical protein